MKSCHIKWFANHRDILVQRMWFTLLIIPLCFYISRIENAWLSCTRGILYCCLGAFYHWSKVTKHQEGLECFWQWQCSRTLFVFSLAGLYSWHGTWLWTDTSAPAPTISSRINVASFVKRIARHTHTTEPQVTFNVIYGSSVWMSERWRIIFYLYE